MEINAREIIDLDPGAIPGGSTNLFPAGVIAGGMGPISFDRRVKAWLSLGSAHRYRAFSRCER